MALLISRRKLRAAAKSIHQFSPLVASVFPTPPERHVVEAATVFLYMRAVGDVFGPRFAGMLRAALREEYRYAPAVEIDLWIVRLGEQIKALDEDEIQDAGNDSEAYAKYVQRTLRCLLEQTGFDASDPDVLCKTYQRFDNAMRGIKQHLQGIQRQNSYIMQ